MICNSRASRMLMVGFALLASSGALAQPREPPPAWEDPSGPPTEPDVWLKRLVGRYTFEGMVQIGDCAPLPSMGAAPPPLPKTSCTGIKGKGDCVGIGDGPGVQCVLNVAWQDLYQVNFDSGEVSAVPGAVSYLDPAMILFGLDPGNSAIQYLLVNNKGLPEGGPGFNFGNRATFLTRCVNEPVGCRREIRIDAKPESSLLHISIDVGGETSGVEATVSSVVMTLRRVPQMEAGETSGGSSR
jgi:hypothetical protein